VSRESQPGGSDSVGLNSEIFKKHFKNSFGAEEALEEAADADE